MANYPEEVKAVEDFLAAELEKYELQGGNKYDCRENHSNDKDIFDVQSYIDNRLGQIHLLSCDMVVAEPTYWEGLSDDMAIALAKYIGMYDSEKEEIDIPEQPAFKKIGRPEMSDLFVYTEINDQYSDSSSEIMMVYDGTHVLIIEASNLGYWVMLDRFTHDNSEDPDATVIIDSQTTNRDSINALIYTRPGTETRDDPLGKPAGIEEVLAQIIPGFKRGYGEDDLVAI